MGNAYNIKHWVGTITDDPELRPGYESTPTFDPMFGFKNGRKERGKLESIMLQPRISQLGYKSIRAFRIFKCPYYMFLL